MVEHLSLREAIAKWVQPGMHLHFASTPSRSNAAIVALAQAFGGHDPGFVLSTTGFHSTAHLLALARLGRRYIASFFGDNYPSPRPNALYQELHEKGQLEHWSLLTYVQSLRAAALGHEFAVTRSLAGSSLAQGLERAGRYRELEGPRNSAKGLAAVAAMTPDITFLHAPAADSSGRALFSPPYSEGFAAALAARQGVIITTDRVVDAASIDRYPGWVLVPPQRVLALVEARFGAHPQPVYLAAPELRAWSYRDDFDCYVWWRRLSQEPERFSHFRAKVLERDDAWRGYLELVGSERLRGLVGDGAEHAVASVSARSGCARAAQTGNDERGGQGKPSAGVRQLAPQPGVPSGSANALEQRQRALAGPELCARIVEGGYHAVLAGIGLAFAAARLGRRLLLAHDEAHPLELLVETGLCGLREDSSRSLDDFLLSSRNYGAASRLGCVESVLGVQVSGPGTRCLAIVGAGQVAPCGSWNSTRVDGRLLVGSGGAADIAVGADEVLVITRWKRLVPSLEYVTGVGGRVSRVITEHGVLRRQPIAAALGRASDRPEPTTWKLCATGLRGDELDRLLRECPWPNVIAGSPAEQEALGDSPLRLRGGTRAEEI